MLCTLIYINSILDNVARQHDSVVVQNDESKITPLDVFDSLDVLQAPVNVNTEAATVPSNDPNGTLIFNGALNTVRGSFNQGDSRFSDASRGRQCVCNSLVAICILQTFDSTCSSSDLDSILTVGDTLYKNVRKNVNTDFLEISQLPSSYKYEDTIYCINVTEDDFIGICSTDLELALESSFKHAQSAILLLDSTAIAVFLDRSGLIVLFDSHARSKFRCCFFRRKKHTYVLFFIKKCSILFK